MNVELYQDIFKRKSFHLFRSVSQYSLNDAEHNEITKASYSFDPLYPDIRTAVRIVSARSHAFKGEAEACILLYSEKKDNYLLNIGYLGQQLDLWLTHHNIGSLWFGLGKPDLEQYNGLDFVIMIAIHKVDDASRFRKHMYKSNCKPLEELWQGDTLGIAEIARFAPNACNSQPWFVHNEGGVLTVSRRQKPGRIGIMPPKAVPYFNRIDMGIYLCILELCLEHSKIKFDRTLFTDDGAARELTKTAEYRLC